VVVSTTAFFSLFIKYVYMPTDQLRIGKYVIVKNQPILFPLELVHSDVVNNAQSAGFFILQVTGLSVEVYCWGESASLNLKSDEAVMRALSGIL